MRCRQLPTVAAMKNKKTPSKQKQNISYRGRKKACLMLVLFPSLHDHSSLVRYPPRSTTIYCEAKRPPIAGTKLSREKDPVFPQKAFQTNFFAPFEAGQIFKKNYYPLSKNGPEKFIIPKRCCPQGILLFSPVFFYFFLFSFFLFPSALAETSYSYIFRGFVVTVVIISCGGRDWPRH